MIPMRQFLREYAISGEVIPCNSEGWRSALDGAAYRVVLHRGPRTFEMQVQRPAGAPSPSVNEGVAEIARLLSTSSDGGESSQLLDEAGRLRAFLGDEGYTDLMFEFGRRPEAQIEQGDAMGDPARPDEMTNQEPSALEQARGLPTLPSLTRYLIGVPILAAGAAGIMFARGRRAAGIAFAAGGAAVTVAGAASAMFWRRGQQHRTVKETLGTLTDQNAAIQTGAAQAVEPAS